MVRLKKNNAATTAAGAMLNCFAEVGEDILSYDPPKQKLQMAINARQLWPDWLDKVNHYSGHNLALSYGTYVIHNAQNGGIDDASFDAVVSSLKSHQEPFEWVKPKNICGLNPSMPCRPLEAVYIPKEGFINPIALLTAYEAYFEQNEKAHLFNHFISNLSFNNNEFLLQLDDGRHIKAKKIIIAAGAYSQQLIDQLPELAKNIPLMMSSVGCAMLAARPEGQPCIDSVIRTPRRAGSCGIHILPHGDDSLYLGATAYYSSVIEHQPKLRYIYNLQRNILEQFNKDYHDLKIQSFIVGNRPVTIDGCPVVGRTSLDNLWLATGTYRDGFHHSPLIAKSIADDITAERSDHGKIPDIFKPERSPISYRSKERAIAQTAKELKAAFYEYGGNDIFEGASIVDAVEPYLNEKIERFYDELNIDFTLSTEMIVLLMRKKQNSALISKFKSRYQR